ncbi:MAG: AAA family ATPase [Actinobacteria bacterium]|nr:AAA family ATPase [Actinomycetota bacterium]
MVGDLVNTASRLQSIAEPGSVFIGGPTHELVRGVMECTDRGSHDLKGKSEPVPVFRVERIIAGHGGRRRADTLEPPFVGRDDELRVLKDQFNAVGRDGRARLVSLVGAGGIGKSRLTWELFKYVDGLASRNDLLARRPVACLRRRPAPVVARRDGAASLRHRRDG